MPENSSTITTINVELDCLLYNVDKLRVKMEFSLRVSAQELSRRILLGDLEVARVFGDL